MTVYVISTGLGVWGMNQTVGWGFPIATFVFWVGIGHAGTLISAILFLFRQKWRSSLNRAAEAMTLFAVACAGGYVLIHLGRVWVSWWMVPAPSATAIYPNFRSALSWDFAAIATYGTVSLMFWYVGLDSRPGDPARSGTEPAPAAYLRLLRPGLAGLGAALAQLRDGLLDAGRTGDSSGGQRAHDRQLRLRHLGDTGLARHIFPPYFVTGAIFSGLAMVITLMVPLRVLAGSRT